jgi:hypothetical protein
MSCRGGCMKKIFIAITMLCIFSCCSYAEDYIFPAKNIKEIDVIINNGTLNIKSANVKEIKITITPNKSSDVNRQIYLVGGKELNVYLVDSEITEQTIVDMIIPKTMDLEINSTLAKIIVDNLEGFLSIDTADGDVNVNNFKGKFELDTIRASVNANGIFKSLNIENSSAHIKVHLNKLPLFYDYSIQGSGNISFYLDKTIKKDNIVIDSHEFKGIFEIK